MSKLKSHIIKEKHDRATKIKCHFLNDDLFITMGKGYVINSETDFTRINALYEYFKQNKATIRDKIIVDFGAGNGALPVALNLLGAKKVVAIDYNDLAIYSCILSAKKYNVNIEVKKHIDYSKIYGDIFIASGVFANYYDYKRNWEYVLFNMRNIPCYLCSERLCKDKAEDIRIVNPNIVYSNNNIEIINEFESWYYDKS